MHFTYSRAARADPVCINSTSCLRTRHAHRDAGFVLWMGNCALRNALVRQNVFMGHFFPELLARYASAPYGVDEMGLDQFLHTYVDVSQLGAAQTLHEHRLVPLRPKKQVDVALPPLAEGEQDLALPRLRFTGQETMLVCSRVTRGVTQGSGTSNKNPPHGVASH